MVNRQPSVAVAFSTNMPRGSKLRNLVSRYCVNMTKSRRKRLTRELVPVDVPPPPPPKEKTIHVYSEADGVDAGVRHEYITHAIFLAQDMSRLSWSQPPHSMPQMHRPAQAPTPSPVPTLSKGAHSPQMLSPAEIRQRRVKMGKSREQQPTSEDVLRQEAERKARLRQEKEELEWQLQREEEQRKLALEEDLRLAARLRIDKEERERREEEEKHQKLEARRKADRERRIRQAQKMQEWREQQARQMEEDMRRKAEMRTHLHEERLMRTLPSVSFLADNVPQEESFHCWVTMQKCDNVAWRRRFCRVEHTQLALYKDVASSLPMELIDISAVRALKERADDREELEGLSHAFALDVEAEVSYILFTDNENDKETLVSLIVQTAGL